MSFGRRTTNNPITGGFTYGTTRNSSPPTVTFQGKLRRTADGIPHVCADGHSHATETEVVQCIEAHRVYVCASNHMHTERCDGERCDQIKREEQQFQDKELQRQHDREMMDKQLKLTTDLKMMNWNFQKHGVPRLEWKD